jgi:hypothetical protein
VRVLRGGGVSATAPERWAAFLRQIEERHAALLDEAEVVVKEALPACNYDPIPISTAWVAVSYRLTELERRIGDTWGDKVEPAYEAEGHSVDVQMAALDQGRALAYELENRRSLREARVFADAARQLYAVSVATQKERSCPSCGAPLAVPIAYRAVNLRCAHCGALSMFEPGTLARNVVAFGAHPIATEVAANEWLQMREAGRRLNAVRPPASLELLKDYERAQIAYWFRYISAKAVLEPELRDVAHEVRSRLDSWYRTSAEFEPSWVAAGRPREQF